ncbi:MAG: hypothetical protein M3259_06195 [Actinomycetota bacterium]|nr:hypothetical protein [Actinomycetota bacterium]
MNERHRRKPRPGSQAWHQEAPMVVDALRRGTLVRVTLQSGSEHTGYVCDTDPTGLLLDPQDTQDDDTLGYRLFPWHVIEYVTISPEARHRVPGEAASPE